MQEMWVRSLGWDDSLEDETTVHSSNLAWRIPWTEEPSGLQSVGSQSESESHSVLSESLRPVGLYSPWNSPGQNTGVDSFSLLQGIFPTQVSRIVGRFFTSWATRVPKSQTWLKQPRTHACTRTKHFRTWFSSTFLRKKNVLNPLGLCDENNADNVPMERWKMRTWKWWLQWWWYWHFGTV